MVQSWFGTEPDQDATSVIDIIQIKGTRVPELAEGAFFILKTFDE